MSDWKPDEGHQYSAEGKRFGIVASRFNDFIVERLIAGAKNALSCHGASDAAVYLLRVPGAFELPYAAQLLARERRFDAIIALGCIIRGATPHFEYVSGACVNGLADVALSSGIPVVLGVLTTDSIDQAEERAGPGPDNKGYEAALTAIEMAGLSARINRA